MPELPDVELYVYALKSRLLGQPLADCVVASPFLLRTVTPKPSAAFGHEVTTIERLGKRIVIGFSNDMFFIVHLMIAGRFAWKSEPSPVPKRNGLARFDFPSGSLLLTEAGTKKRASLSVVQGRDSVEAHNPGGQEPLDISLAEFKKLLAESPHTLKRTLTDPRTFSGIGNAYSDEILHHAQLSPFKRSPSLSQAEAQRLWHSCKEVLSLWRDRLIEQTGNRFPTKVTAFRPEMAVHGKFSKPCPVCAKPVQRIVYAQKEANYCAQCQTEGRLLSDRALARLLKGDWPKTLEELELRQAKNRSTGEG